MRKRTKRKTGRLGHVTRKEIDFLQDGLDRMGSREYMLLAEKKPRQAMEQSQRLKGALEAAEAVGAHCSCFYVTERLRQCACGTTTPAMVDRKRRKKVAYKRFLSKSLDVAGVHCRDGQGIFVPVPQCRRKKVSKRTALSALSGVHCRDGQGIFVPVPQCRRKKARA